MPADQPELLAKADRGGADVVILDLEDSVSPENKCIARQLLSKALAVRKEGKPLCIRVNHSIDLLADLDVAVIGSVSSVMLPKSESAEEIQSLEGQIRSREKELGLPSGKIGIVALVETPTGIMNCREIARSPGVVALAFGTEDFAQNMGALPSEDLFSFPLASISVAAASAGIGAIGLATSLRIFSDMEKFRRGVEHALAIGMTGCLCIHPRQVEAAKQVFASSEAQLSWARVVVEAWANRPPGVGAIAVNGEMVDRPVLELAKQMLGAGSAS